jgi:hypothetical protein
MAPPINQIARTSSPTFIGKSTESGVITTYEEVILHADVDRRTVLEESQNFDHSGHYSRPDLLRLTRN